jgi:hypothetical protein
MVLRTASLAVLWIAVVIPTFGQASQLDSQTPQQILIEIKALHDELKTTEASQILLSELAVQGVVNRATQRVDEARSKILEVQAEQRHIAGELARAEDQLNQTADLVRKKKSLKALSA